MVSDMGEYQGVLRVFVETSRRRVAFKEALERFQGAPPSVGDNWFGRIVRIPLAEPISFNDQLWRAVRLVHGNQPRVPGTLSEYDPGGETLSAQLPALRRRLGDTSVPGLLSLGWQSEEQEARCVMHRGGIFRSELQLE